MEDFDEVHADLGRIEVDGAAGIEYDFLFARFLFECFELFVEGSGRVFRQRCFAADADDVHHAEAFAEAHADGKRRKPRKRGIQSLFFENDMPRIVCKRAERCFKQVRCHGGGDAFRHDELRNACARAQGRSAHARKLNRARIFAAAAHYANVAVRAFVGVVFARLYKGQEILFFGKARVFAADLYADVYIFL